MTAACARWGPSHLSLIHIYSGGRLLQVRVSSERPGDGTYRLRGPVSPGTNTQNLLDGKFTGKNLPIGSLKGQTIKISISNMNAATLGVSGLTVDKNSTAGVSMSKIQAAIDKVSTQRSNLGALQNRLEHTINNLDTTSENTSAAESRIRDTDMADEMVRYSKNNILSQAGNSMLAQANQQTQGVLSLLQ